MFALLKKYERFMVIILMVLMSIVLGLSTLDLGWVIIKDILSDPVLLLSVDELLDLFGFFMLVIIGIELLETIMKTYLIQDQPHFEVVLSVAIIAIARKVIILDIKQVDGISLIGIAAIVLALTIGYFLMKRSHPHDDEEQADSLLRPGGTRTLG